VVLSFFVGCGQDYLEGDQVVTDSTLKPDSEVSGATIFLYDRDVTRGFAPI
jgi:hypothetical protein